MIFNKLSQVDINKFLVATDPKTGRNRQQANQLDESQKYRAVSLQNKLAALDFSDLTVKQSVSGKFSFSFNSDTKISWDGALPQGQERQEITTHFSFAFSFRSSSQVTLAKDVELSESKIRGEDFSFDRRSGELMVNRAESEESASLNLSDRLSSEMISVMERLGLVDDNGKANLALQFLSDYADLGRFKAGQQIKMESNFEYSSHFRAEQLNWQAWNQRNELDAK